MFQQDASHGDFLGPKGVRGHLQALLKLRSRQPHTLAYPSSSLISGMRCCSLHCGCHRCLLPDWSAIQLHRHRSSCYRAAAAHQIVQPPQTLTQTTQPCGWLWGLLSVAAGSLGGRTARAPWQFTSASATLQHKLLFLYKVPMQMSILLHVGGRNTYPQCSRSIQGRSMELTVASSSMALQSICKLCVDSAVAMGSKYSCLGKRVDR